MEICSRLSEDCHSHTRPEVCHKGSLSLSLSILVLHNWFYAVPDIRSSHTHTHTHTQGPMGVRNVGKLCVCVCVCVCVCECVHGLATHVPCASG